MLPLDSLPGREERMVEHVNELHPELQFHLFAQLDVFPQTDVHVVDCVDSYVTESQRQRAQVIHRSSTVCISHSRMPPQVGFPSVATETNADVLNHLFRVCSPF